MPLNESPAEQSAVWYQPSDTPSVPFSPQGGQNHITSWLCRPASETRQGWPQPHSTLAQYWLCIVTYCLRHHDGIEIDTLIEVIVVSPLTWEAHHSPRAWPSSCGELPRSLVTPQWPQSWYNSYSQFLPFRYFPISIIVKTNVSYWISRLYLAGVAAAQLQWHLSNTNVIQVI